MKIIKLNSFFTFLISMLFIGFVVLLPIVLLQVVWNETIGNSYDYLVISLWQALILWLIVLTILNIFGLFKFEFKIQSIGQDKDTIEKTIEELTKNPPEKTSEPNRKD